MENLESVRFLVRKGDWLEKVDLKDAYFTVAVKESHHKYLRFRWKGCVFEFNCMAFGLAPAPRIFTKILKTVMAFLRRQGIRLVIYLDDILILNESKSGLVADINTVIDLLQSLGFLINREKSIIAPTQTIEYLGLIVDSTDPSFSLPSSKAEAVKRMCEGAYRETFLGRFQPSHSRKRIIAAYSVFIFQMRNGSILNWKRKFAYHLAPG